MIKPVTQRTIFTMGREKLEQRILNVYADSSDADSVIQYLVAVMIRHCLCISDFSGICAELVQEIFLSAAPTDVLRKLCPLFRDSFSGKEWEQVTKRLYSNVKEYHRYNNRLSDCKKYLFAQTTPQEELDGQQYKLVSTFEDAVGKIHTWSLRDADKNASALKIDAVLELLSSLTIFEKDGIRRFVKLENSEIANCTRYIKIRKGKVMEEPVQMSTGHKVTEIGEDTSQQLSSEIAALSEEERIELVKLLLPQGVTLADTRTKEANVEKSTDNEEIKASSMSVAAIQEAPLTEGRLARAKEAATTAENPVTETAPAQTTDKLPKSEKQKALQAEPQKKQKKGLNNSKKGKGKDRKRRRRK